MATDEEISLALKRPYVYGETTCALCGGPADVLYHDHGGWWCRKHENIPRAAFVAKQEPLEQGIARFIKYHA